MMHDMAVTVAGMFDVTSLCDRNEERSEYVVMSSLLQFCYNSNK